MKVKLSHKFLKGVVRLCLIMLSIITIGVLALAWHSQEQLSSSTVLALTGAWCSELLMSLLRRNKSSKEQPQDNINEDSAI